jgi:hypothetical protein
MLPEKESIDAVFGIVEALYKSERKGLKDHLKGLKTDFSSRLSILSIWIPVILFIFALGAAGIYKYELFGKPELLRSIGLILVLLMYLAVFLGQIASLFSTFSACRNALGSIIDRTRKCADRDAQHVNDFFKYESAALKYVLVQMKAEKTAWERHISLFAGAIEKIGIIGMIPGVAALISIYTNPNNLSSPWIRQIADLLIYGTPVLYIMGMWYHHLISRFDRYTMLIEMVIEAKKSEESLTPLPQDILVSPNLAANTVRHASIMRDVC